ncbi:MAG TPA: organoarsenical effux MFS transporter ArsJ [Accumulibacter sp.]|uniref:organoarsenical effux MFS transporter ArsJ n=1 Tax=Accumulibacter sp. TaxID=2053492 RepID=UPI0025FCA8E7|nr:organoarsenical effux MFS transporter ArsJ [Accumulibacter sp.]MCM8600476.1 organoarsenical effux MFS transporter ArsJ [Accumulibacter sp.]MCM8663063.1 organoarsenical effux MFS transporter ArsJ [Accumulibacter sp.]HNC51682.1 organoarsenical effux MFS transporter ArsJ [Accumulibacter sp.]
MSDSPAAAPAGLRNYVLVTGAYWADTVTDGATRMLVLFHFYNLGYTPFAVASLFIFYEVFGILTNLFGGYLGARFGLKTTLFAGLTTQIVALSMLAFAPPDWLVVAWVMVSQALSGIAKDMTKMSSKSAVKLIVPEGASATLYRWVAILTGSKNALKGVGFFLGGLLLTLLDFQTVLRLLVAFVGGTLVLAAVLMRGGLGQANRKAKFGQMFSRNGAVNKLAAARIFLFGARDVWFVVGLPVFLASVLGWSFWQSGGFLALWVIGYGIVQAATPGLLRSRVEGQHEPDGRTATILAFVLAALPAGIALGLRADLAASAVVVAGLIVFGAVFALNSAVHSYLILAYTDSDKVAMNVGFYYMANAAGRLAGTVLSGALYQWGAQSGPNGGLIACLWASTACVLVAGLLSLLLPRHSGPRSKPIRLGDLGD